MTLRPWLTVSMILTVGFGLFALVSPDTMGRTYGNPTTPDAALWGRYYGSAVASLGAITGFVLASRDPRLQGMLALLLATFYGVNLAISLAAQAGGIVNAMGWTNVALQALMTAALGSLALSGRRRGVQGGRPS